MADNKKALIAMSGGVDSSVASYLAMQAGYDCAGAIMKLLCDNSKFEQDASDAKAVCDRVGIPFHIFDLCKEFKSNVIDNFVHSYKIGATPNPCVVCNRLLKFGIFGDKAKEMGYDYVITGHYARVQKQNGRYVIKKALDLTKDQSYMLYSLSQEQLARIVFPLGEITKAQAREIAEKNGFVNARKHDSQDICFVPDGDYAEVIESYTGKIFKEGNFVSKDGEILGKHKGIIRYTIGQRKGLGLAMGEPVYVCDKDIDKNEVIVCSNEELFSNELEAEDFNWMAFDEPPKKIRAKAKIRYRQTEQWAEIEQLDNGRVRVTFDEPQRAIAKGQAVVIYDGDTVIGGGTIC